MVNITSLLCCHKADPADERAPHFIRQTDAMARIMEEEFGLPVPSDLASPYTAEYLQDLEAKYRQHQCELFAIK
jgi:hypothetical protein